MNPYSLEMLARDRQREMLREADKRRLLALARVRPDEQRPSAARLAGLAAIANALRTMVVPGRKVRIEQPGLGDAS